MKELKTKKELGKNISAMKLNKPKKLYAVGNEKLLNDSSVKICIVGSRRYSSYGFDATQAIIEGLKGYDVSIISGLALGIDATVHNEALKHGIPCIAIPGSGLNDDVLYPRTHLDLAKEIVANNGVLVSEFEPDFRASPWSFPMRNRIMAGMADAVVIIEAESDSGTLITANLANEYGRKVFAVPHNVFSETGKGCNIFIQQGKARPVITATDLIESLNLKLK